MADTLDNLTFSRVWTDPAAFPGLSYSKDWTSQSDFPTIETDEETVREDMQCLYNEIKDYVNSEGVYDPNTGTKTGLKEYVTGIQTEAEGSAEDAEAYAAGTRKGEAVASDDPAYHNNAKYYAEAAGDSATAAALSEGAASGSAEAAAGSAATAKDYADHIADPVSGIVTTWLESNIDPETGYVLDSSLLSDEAAAPAGKVGAVRSAANSYAARLKTLSAEHYLPGKFCWDNLAYFDGWLDTTAFKINGGTHVVIPVTGGGRFRVRKDSANSFLFYIVKSYTPPTSNDLTVDFATGESARRSVNGTEADITLPPDAKYVVCSYTDSSHNSRQPLYMFVDNYNFIQPIPVTDEPVAVDYITTEIPLSGYSTATNIPVNKISISASDNKVFTKIFDGTLYWYPELDYAVGTRFLFHGIEIVKESTGFRLGQPENVLSGIGVGVTSMEPNKLYWHTTKGAVLKGGYAVSNNISLTLELTGDEVFVFNGENYVAQNGKLIRVGTVYDAMTADAVRTVKALDPDGDFVRIAFITDTHSTNSVYNGPVPNMTFPGASVAVMRDLVGIPGLIDYSVHGGDVLTTYNAKTMFPKEALQTAVNENAAFYKQMISGLLFVKGNHDNGHNDDAGYDLTNAEWKAIFQASIPGAVFGTEAGACYFYIDDADKKVRLIVLDSWHEPYNSTTLNFGEAQETWFAETALDFTGKSGWTVVVISHYWTGSTNMSSILSTFKAGGTAKLAGVIMGHTHQDGYSNAQGYNAIQVERSFATCNEVSMPEAASVDVFTIDTENDVLYQTRIGRGSSHAYSFGATSAKQY